MTPSLIFLFSRAHFWENNDDRQGCMDKDRCIYHYHRRLSPIHPGLIARTSHIFPNIHSYPRPACSRNPSKFHARRRHGAWIFWLQNSHQPTQQTKKKKKTFMAMGSCFSLSQFACEEPLQCPKQNCSVVGIGVWVWGSWRLSTPDLRDTSNGFSAPDLQYVRHPSLVCACSVLNKTY